jgi:hypothetical protein
MNTLGPPKEKAARQDGQSRSTGATITSVSEFAQAERGLQLLSIIAQRLGAIESQLKKLPYFNFNGSRS